MNRTTIVAVLLLLAQPGLGAKIYLSSGAFIPRSAIEQREAVSLTQRRSFNDINDNAAAASNNPGSGNVLAVPLGDDFFPRVPLIDLDNDEGVGDPTSNKHGGWDVPENVLAGDKYAWGIPKVETTWPPTTTSTPVPDEPGFGDPNQKPRRPPGVSSDTTACRLISCNFENDQLCNWKQCSGCALALPLSQRIPTTTRNPNLPNPLDAMLDGPLGDLLSGNFKFPGLPDFGEIFSGLPSASDLLGAFSKPKTPPRTELAPPADLPPPPMSPVALPSDPLSSFFPGRRRRRRQAILNRQKRQIDLCQLKWQRIN